MQAVKADRFEYGQDKTMCTFSAYTAFQKQQRDNYSTWKSIFKKKGSNLFPAVVTVTRTWCASRRSAVHNSQGADTLKQAVKAGVMNSVRLHTKSAQTRHVKNWTVTAINNMDTQHCKWGLLTRQKNCVRIVSSSCVWHTAVSLHLKQKGQSLVKRDGQRREVRVGRDQVKVFT